MKLLNSKTETFEIGNDGPIPYIANKYIVNKDDDINKVPSKSSYIRNYIYGGNQSFYYY